MIIKVIQINIKFDVNYQSVLKEKALILTHKSFIISTEIILL